MKYFIKVVLGVLIKPKNAIEYALIHTNNLFLVFMLTISIWFGGYARFFILSLENREYLNIKFLYFIFFLIVFILLYSFSKIFKSKVRKKDIAFVLLLINIVYFPILPIVLIILLSMGFTKETLNIDYFDLPIVLAVIGVIFVYVVYIFTMLLNKVQKIPIWKTILILMISHTIIASLIVINNHFAKEEKDFVVDIYKTMLNHTKKVSKKIDYNLNIAEIYEEQELYENAISHYFKALEYEDDNVSKSEYYYWIADNYRKLDMNNKALIYAEKSLKLTPEDEDSIKQVNEIKNEL